MRAVTATRPRNRARDGQDLHRPRGEGAGNGTLVLRRTAQVVHRIGGGSGQIGRASDRFVVGHTAHEGVFGVDGADRHRTDICQTDPGLCHLAGGVGLELHCHPDDRIVADLALQLLVRASAA